MDENRLFGNSSADVANMVALVKRDRNHPSVVIWSFCNEVGCEGQYEAAGPPFQAAATKHDGTRPTLANMFTYGDALSRVIDVQGFSHQERQALDACHAEMPSKPIFASECCSCNSQRGEDVGCESRCYNASDCAVSLCVERSFNADCIQHQVSA